MGIEEHLGAKVADDLQFLDTSYKYAKLADLLAQGRPVIVTPVFYRCQMLCGLVLTSLTRSLEKTGLVLGKDYLIATISFDPGDTPPVAAERQGHFLQSLNEPDKQSAWQFWVGTDKEIKPLMDSLGFRYRYDPQTKQFAHGAAVMVLTPKGIISRYLYGIEFPAKDVKLAILEAGEGRIGTTFERVVMTCFKYDPVNRRYAFFLSWYLRAGGLLLLGGLGFLVGRLVLWERRAAAK